MSAAVYLAAIVAANLSVAAFGPDVVVVNAFLLIGLDLTLRDRLHDSWGPGWRMFALILAGGVISYALNAGQVAIASTVAFVVASGLDALTYHLLGDRARLLRVNGSNVVGAAADSLIFPALAFGWPLLWSVVLGLFVAKVAGGFLWSLILVVPLRRRAA
jgi:uncharacterized PurR-regulated membrane protein YhhQ (DUF165 family)